MRLWRWSIGIDGVVYYESAATVYSGCAAAQMWRQASRPAEENDLAALKACRRGSSATDH